MPCPDGREEEDRLTANRHHDAMIALLCGVMSQPPGPHTAYHLARRWCNHHVRIDKHMANGVSKWDPRVEHLRKCCDKVLEEAYQELCV